jgi:hypothetical protein
VSRKSKKSQRRTAAAGPGTDLGTLPTPEPGFPERSARSTQFNPDYSYVYQDLKRIGLLAGTFIILLLIASFFVR